VKKEAIHLKADRKWRAREELGTRYNLQSYTPINLSCPMMPYLLKFSDPAKIVPPSSNLAFNT
jgi:hypothetical protein